MTEKPELAGLPHECRTDQQNETNRKSKRAPAETSKGAARQVAAEFKTEKEQKHCYSIDVKIST